MVQANVGMYPELELILRLRNLLSGVEALEKLPVLVDPTIKRLISSLVLNYL